MNMEVIEEPISVELWIMFKLQSSTFNCVNVNSTYNDNI